MRSIKYTEDQQKTAIEHYNQWVNSLTFPLTILQWEEACPFDFPVKRNSDMKMYSLPEALKYAFDWEKDIDGFEFWVSVYSFCGGWDEEDLETNPLNSILGAEYFIEAFLPK